MSGQFGSIPPGMKKRRVFFSFDYEKDIWRVNQVRLSREFQNSQEVQDEGFFDGSMWETSRPLSSETIKNKIHAGMANTSVTCILSGERTYRREWVRYEIAHSIIKGNGILVVKIHLLKNQNQLYGIEGENPLDFMGVYLGEDDKIYLAEIDPNGNWARYQDYQRHIDWHYEWPKPGVYGTFYPLSICADTYCYVTENGYENLPSWFDEAARWARRH